MYCEMPGILDIDDDTHSKKCLIEIVTSGWKPASGGDHGIIKRLYYRTVARRFTELEATVIFNVYGNMKRKRGQKETVKSGEITSDQYKADYKAKMGLLF